MTRVFSLAAAFSLFATAALAECPGHVSASAPLPGIDMQTSAGTSTIPAPVVATTGTATTPIVVTE